jgi:hypothetical protein
VKAEVSLMFLRCLWCEVGEAGGVTDDDGGSSDAVLPADGFNRGALLLIDER